jgi:tripartite motif-containing protein 2/3/tripartite motif-containing protein 71
MKMKKAVVKQINEMTGNFKPDMLPPCEPADVKFVASPDLSSACQQFGKACLQEVSPEKCYATGKGLEVAKLGERATAVLHIVDDERKAYTKLVGSLTCELVSESTGEKIDCSVKKIEANGQYEISYQATNGRRHQLHIKVEGEHIKGSPFPVTVKLPVEKLGTPIKTISGVKDPWGVAICSKGNIIVAEYNGHCISIFNPKGEKIKSFGSQGSGHGQFNNPAGIAVDDGDNILVADHENNRIQKVTSFGKFITAVKIEHPVSIAVHPQSKNVYVANSSNHCIQILNPDLTFSSSFGSRGSGDGQFLYPYDMAFDSTGNVYVVNCNNGPIQIFAAEGQFLRKFGRQGCNQLAGICIDSEDVVYVTEDNEHRVSVFTCEGQFLISFGSRGARPGQFNNPYGIAVDKNGVVYVADKDNNRLQSF